MTRASLSGVAVRSGGRGSGQAAGRTGARGTLVLEDNRSLPQALQARLLTVINEQGTPAETRIVAICNAPEPEQCEASLRPDLFYRLAAMRIDLPPLRQRGEDILTLFTRFGEQFAEEYATDAPQVTAQGGGPAVAGPLAEGNVRQLINIAETRDPCNQRRGARGSIARS